MLYTVVRTDNNELGKAT